MGRSVVIDGESNLKGFIDGEASLSNVISGEAIQVLVTQRQDAESYTGPYTVTPKAEEQTLNTKDKVMDDDVTIESIPIYEVSNESGGTTFYIADIGG